MSRAPVSDMKGPKRRSDSHAGYGWAGRHMGDEGEDAVARIVVIGGGPAGLLAAATAAGRGHNVLLVEKNDMPGKKLRISGKGRCNLTNNADVEAMLVQVVKNPEFLYSALYTFDNQALMALMEEQGVPVKVERGGRVFPASDKAGDVVGALIRYAKHKGARLMCQSEARSIVTGQGRVRGVILADGRSLACDRVIVATGGKSYPATGSSGDGYRMACQLGHNIIAPVPALTPVEVKEPWVQDLQGLALKNTHLTVYCEGKPIFEDFGEMLFTHYGLSGPMILSASTHMHDVGHRAYSISLDLKPALDEKVLDERVQRDLAKFSRRHFANALGDLLPQKLIAVVVELSGIAPDKPVHQIRRSERLGLVALLKGLTLTPIALRGFKEAIITGGGVDVLEVNPSTMESRKCRGLFFAGEVLDVHAYTGGFNLQIAFSTGYLAGLNT